MYSEPVAPVNDYEDVNLQSARQHRLLEEASDQWKPSLGFLRLIME